jgi:hypothetical protein
MSQTKRILNQTSLKTSKVEPNVSSERYSCTDIPKYFIWSWTLRGFYKRLCITRYRKRGFVCQLNGQLMDYPGANHRKTSFLNLTCTRNKTVPLWVCWLRPNSQLAPMHESGWVRTRLPGISTSLWPMWVIVQGWHVRFNLWTPSPLWPIQNIIMR